MAPTSRRRTDDGIGLIDVMVAFTILLLVLAPLGTLLVSQIHAAITTQQRLAANDLMDTWLGKMQSQGPFWQALSPGLGRANAAVISNDFMDQWIPLGEQFSISATTGAVTWSGTDTTSLNGVTLTSQAMYRWQSQGGGAPNLCSTVASGGSVLMTATVKVSWAGHSAGSVEGTEVITFPSSSSSDGTGADVGYIALQIAGVNAPDASGTSWTDRVTKTPVTILWNADYATGLFTPTTVYPDASGCVFVAVSTSGTGSVGTGYQVELQSQTPQPGAPGYVTFPQGTPANGPLPGNVWVCDPTYATTSCTAPVSTGNVSYEIVGGEVLNLGTVYYDEGVLVDAHYSNSTTVTGGMTCPAGLAVVSCYATGPSSDGTAFAWLDGSTWSQVDVPGLASLAQVACVPSGSDDVCLLAGTSTAGQGELESLVISGTTASIRTDTLPFASSRLTGASCPTRQTPARCVVTSAGGGPSGQVIADGAISSTGDTWWPVSDVMYGTTTTALTSATGVSCLTGANDGCVVTGTGPNGVTIVSGLTSTTGPPVAWVSPSYVGGLTAIAAVQSVTCVSAYGCLIAVTGQASAGAAVTPLLLGIEPATSTSSAPYLVNASAQLAGYAGLIGLTCTGDEPGVLFPGCIVEWSSSTSTAPQAAILGMYMYVPLNLGAVVPAGATAMSPPQCSPVACGVAADVGGVWSVYTSPVPAGLNLSSTDLTVSWTQHAEALGSTIPTSPVCGSSVCMNASTTPLAAPLSTSANTPVAMFTGSQSASSWSQATLPSGASMASVIGSGCSTGTCTIIGIAPSGASGYLVPQSGGSQITLADLGVAGRIGPEVPLSLTNPLFPSGGVWHENLGGGTSPVTPPQTSFTVAPEAQPYALAAAGCAAASTALDTVTLAASVPGATVSASIPLGVLNIAADSSSGSPDANTSITFIDSCGDDMAITTDAAGRYVAAVPIGTYTGYIPHGGTVTITVTPAAQSNGTVTVGPATTLTVS